MITYFNNQTFSRQENKRRTKHINRTLNPEWNCSVTYPNVYREELQNKTIEFTVMDYDRFKSNDFIGMIRIDLKSLFIILLNHFFLIIIYLFFAK